MRTASATPCGVGAVQVAATVNPVACMAFSVVGPMAISFHVSNILKLTLLEEDMLEGAILPSDTDDDDDEGVGLTASTTVLTPEGLKQTAMRSSS